MVTRESLFKTPKKCLWLKNIERTFLWDTLCFVYIICHALLLQIDKCKSAQNGISAFFTTAANRRQCFCGFCAKPKGKVIIMKVSRGVATTPIKTGEGALCPKYCQIARFS